MAAETSQTLDRGLRVLRVLAEAQRGLTVTELSQQMAVNRTVVYRLISTLEQHALIRRDTRGRLFVGLGVLHLASAVQPLVRDLATPVLRSLAEAIGCTAHLTVADGDEALALDTLLLQRTCDFEVVLRLQVAECQVLQLPLELPDAETIGEPIFASVFYHGSKTLKPSPKPLSF